VYYVAEDPQTFQPSYGITNLGVGVRDESGNWGNKVATQALLPRDFERYAGVRVMFDFR